MLGAYYARLINKHKPYITENETMSRGFTPATMNSFIC